MTLRLSPAYLMRQPFELGFSPEASTSTPDLTNSSWYFCMLERSASPGMTPASVSSVALTIIMKRMNVSPCRIELNPHRASGGAGPGGGRIHPVVERQFPISTRARLIFEFGEPPLEKTPLGLLPGQRQ